VESGSLKDFLLARGAAMLRLYGALGIANFGYQALLAWVVVIGLRAFSQTEAEVGAAIGLAALVATPVGFASSLLLTKLFAQRVGPAFPVRLLMIGYLISGPVLGLLWLAPTAEVFYAIIFVGYAINITMGMILPTAIQSLAPPDLRARAISVNFVVNVLLASLAAPLVGFLSDSFGSDPRVILTSALIITVPSLIVAGLVLLTAQKAFAEALAQAQSRGEAA
jgi:cyanate permease